MKDNNLNHNEKNLQTLDNKQVVYRWNYGEQLAYDTKKARRDQRKGAAIYATVLASVFVLCLAILIVLLDFTGMSNRYSDSETGSMTTAEVAQKMYPSTVLILTARASSTGYGSGFFLTSDGYIATNYHVVEGTDKIVVELYNGIQKSASLVGYSQSSDLAVLKISGTGYSSATLGNSDSVVVGDRAIAIGNPMGREGAWTVTQGIISALDRTVLAAGDDEIYEMNMLQTDVAVNFGNSGGPLCNDRGEVIGIVTRKMTHYENAYYEGIGYAIPINGAITILNKIIQTGNPGNTETEVSKSRPLIGISCFTIKKGDRYTYGEETRTAEKSGVMVKSLYSDGAAYGILEIEDIILSINNERVESLDEMSEILYQYKVGDEVSITVWRNGEEKTFRLTLGSSDS